MPCRSPSSTGSCGGQEFEAGLAGQYQEDVFLVAMGMQAVFAAFGDHHCVACQSISLHQGEAGLPSGEERKGAQIKGNGDGGCWGCARHLGVGDRSTIGAGNSRWYKSNVFLSNRRSRLVAGSVPSSRPTSWRECGQVESPWG